jgi:hypothetical protein
MHVLYQAGVDIPDSSSGKPEWVPAEEEMEVIIYELPIERQIIGNEYGMPFRVFL